MPSLPFPRGRISIDGGKLMPDTACAHFVPNRPPWRRERPRLTITCETSAEVRSATTGHTFAAIVHPKLGEIGGRLQEITRAAVTRPERLAPGCRLYILQGRAELPSAHGVTIAGVEYVYAMGSDETFEQAREWLVKAWGLDVR